MDSVLANLVNKVKVLAEKYHKLFLAKEQADRKAAALEQALIEREREVERLKGEIQMLRTAAVLAPNKADVERTRTMISELLKDIDRCISDLQD